MPRRLFRPVAVAPGVFVRFDTASGSDTPADIRPEGFSGVPIAGSIVKSDQFGRLPAIEGPNDVRTLYQKTLGADGSVAATTTLTAGESAGQALPVVPDSTVLLRPTMRMPKHVQGTVVTNFQASHGWSASGSGVASSNLNDTSDYSKGSQSARVTTTGTGATANIEKLNLSSLNLTGKILRITLKVDDITHLSRINVFAGSNSLTDYFKWFLQTKTSSTDWVQSGEWLTITLPWGDQVTGGGTPARNAVTAIRIQVTDDNTGNAVTMRVQSVELIPDASTPFPNGVISVVTDDINDNLMLLKAKMDALGYTGTMHVIAESVDQPGRLTLAQLKAMHDQGWEIAPHAFSSANHNATGGLTSLTTSQLEAELASMKAWLLANGFKGDIWAYPQGKFDAATIKVMKKYFSGARTIIYADHKESFPPADPYRLRAISGISSVATAGDHANPTKLAQSGGIIETIKANAEWLILVFHQIVTTTPSTSTECAQSDMNTILDKIATEAIPCMPIGDVLSYYG